MKKPQCSRCGRPLTDPYSIAVGMGPECRGAAARRGVKFPKAKYHVSHGRVIFDGLEKAEPPTANTTESKADEKREIVLRAKRNGWTFRQAVSALRDYMLEKDSHVSIRWCEKFAYEIWKEQA